MRRPRPRPDWHPADVKAALHKAGFVMSTLAVEHGLHPSTVSIVLRRPAQRVQGIIAAALKTKPQIIWPSRYHADGSPRRRGQYQRDGASTQRQKRQAA